MDSPVVNASEADTPRVVAGLVVSLGIPDTLGRWCPRTV
jgi:hypothetical protein